tara:strand:+ start:9520 stop:9840 length:321 start_codon:yes stop_codon:yes gene_type:complete
VPVTHEERAARRKEIAEFCRENPVKAACAKFGVGPTLVRGACDEYGVMAARADGEPPESRLKLVADLVNSDYTFASLGDYYGLSRQAVQQFAAKCKAAGLRVRDRS